MKVMMKVVIKVVNVVMKVDDEGSDECGEWLIYMGISDQRDQLYQLNHRGQ